MVILLQKSCCMNPDKAPAIFKWPFDSNCTHHILYTFVNGKFMTEQKTVPWSHKEVGTFLSLIAEDRVQREVDGATQNEKIFQEMSRLMASFGYDRT